MDLTTKRADGTRAIRNRETNLGDLCADAYRAISGADIALVNGGGIRADIPAGNITYGQIIKVHPYGNALCVVEATGQEIIDALEWTARNTMSRSKTSPEGGALGPVISRWLSSVQGEVAQSGVLPESPDFGKEVSKRVFALSKKMENSVGGFDFASVINSYYRAETEGSDELKSACLRWLRGEYTTKTEAREYLSVGSLISDDNWYDYIKLWAEFVKSIGYRGFVVFIDECVNLYKITNRVSRENNYEKILSMFNDTLQGRAPGLCMIMGGTPQFLEDTRRGLFSYEALRSRLADGRFTGSGEFRDMLGPVIRLRRLSDNELFALISRLTKLHGMYYSWEPRVTEEQQAQFLREAVSRTGADTMMTPREMIRDYMSVLNILLQNPSAGFTDVVRSSASQAAAASAAEETKEISLDDIEI